MRTKHKTSEILCASETRTSRWVAPNWRKWTYAYLEEARVVGVPGDDGDAERVAHLQQVLPRRRVFAQVVGVAHVEHGVDLLVEDGGAHGVEDLGRAVVVHEEHLADQVVHVGDGEVGVAPQVLDGAEHRRLVVAPVEGVVGQDGANREAGRRRLRLEALDAGVLQYPEQNQSVQPYLRCFLKR